MNFTLNETIVKKHMYFLRFSGVKDCLYVVIVNIIDRSTQYNGPSISSLY